LRITILKLSHFRGREPRSGAEFASKSGGDPSIGGSDRILKARASKEPTAMPQGDKSKYTGKQKRQAEHIAEGYENRGVSDNEAESRAWATVNKESGGGNKSGSGRGVRDTKVSSKKGGKLGGSASASRTPEQRSASAKKAAETRKKNRQAKSG
jgi:hypothetical protein